MKINWMKKFSSRKFWMALIGFISTMMFAFKFSEGDVQRVTAIISSMGVLVAYILAEGFIDGKSISNEGGTDDRVDN